MDKDRPLSWSAISSFKYDPEQWYRKYILGQKEPPSEAMIFGKYVGDRLASDPDFLPEVPRYKVFEQKLTGKVGNIPLLGFLDGFNPETRAFYEYKTSANTKRWTSKTVQEHGQILMYMYLLYTNYGIAPEKIGCHLVYIPVCENALFNLSLSPDPIQIFGAKHTTLDVLRFANDVKEVYKEMEAYALAHSIAS